MIEKGKLRVCEPHEATYVEFLVPSGLFEYRRLMIGDSKKPNQWSWNYDVDEPTFRPSVLSKASWAGKPWLCHSYITNGVVKFLGDCTHNNKNKSMPLKDVE